MPSPADPAGPARSTRSYIYSAICKLTGLIGAVGWKKGAMVHKSRPGAWIHLGLAAARPDRN